jgi:hypothetical protein
MPVQIGEMHTEVDVRPPEPASAAARAPMTHGNDRMELERLRPLVLQILREELDRLRRQQG